MNKADTPITWAPGDLLRTLEAHARPILAELPEGFPGIATRVAFEPGAGAWSQEADGVSLDLAGLLARPWRHGPNALADLLDSHDALTGLFNVSLMCKIRAGLDVGARSEVGKVAVDAGPCWIMLHGRGIGRAFRKDGQPSDLLERDDQPSWQKTPNWPIHELDQISNALWALCLSAHHMLETDWRKDPLCSAALSEVTAIEERSCLSEVAIASPSRGRSKTI